MNNLEIINTFDIIEGEVRFNGQKWTVKNEENTALFLYNIYNASALEYPKFHKMDVLSQAGVLAGSVLTEAVSIDEHPLVLLFNEKSSMQSDLKHIKQYNETIPSPSTFVYTLPNICIGEICIYHGWHSPTSFLVLKSNDYKTYLDIVEASMKKYNCKYVLCGFLDATENDTFVATALVKYVQGKDISHPADNYFKNALEPLLWKESN